MFASIEYHNSIQLRINDGTGKSIIIATLPDIEKARKICDDFNENCKFNAEIFKVKK